MLDNGKIHGTNKAPSPYITSRSRNADVETYLPTLPFIEPEGRVILEAARRRYCPSSAIGALHHLACYALPTHAFQSMFTCPVLFSGEGPYGE
jgi:uncharacterized membrane protein